MTHRKLKAYLKEHPELLDDNFALAGAEAREMLRSADHVLTFEEMIEGAKRRFPQYTAEQWADFDRCIERKRKKGRPSAGPRRVCRLALAGLMGLAVCFFALFPTGRALAASIFSLTMSVFANEATISPPEDARPADSGDERLTFTSVEAFEERTGLSVLTFREDWLELVSFSGEYVPDATYTAIFNYEDPAGRWLRVIQMWPLDQNVHVWTNGGLLKQADLGNGRIFYYNFDPDDRALGGLILWGSSVVVLGAHPDIGTAQVMDALKHAD